MKVLYLSYYFPPEIGSGPHLPYELCESLAKQGHEVSAVTAFPRYHMAVMPQQYRGHFLYTEEMGGFKTYRINAPNAYTKMRYLRGFVQQIVPWMLAVRAILLKDKPDIVYTQIPPLSMGLAARLVARRFGIPCVVNVQDLFPQCAVDLGLLHNKSLIRLMEWIERDIYKKTDMVTVMSEGNRDFVISRGGSPDRTMAIPNWVDTELIRPSERINDFRKIHGLGNEFIVLFAGTMGWSQGLSTVVEAARLLVGEPGLVFLFVGDGMELEKLQKQAEGLVNVRFLPMQSKAVYPSVLAASDVSLVTLRPEVATPTFPSKICTIMAAGRPIIASIPPIEDAPRMIRETNCGFVVPAADPKALADAVLLLKNDEQTARQMGINGRMYVENHLSRDICVRQNEDLFRMMTGKKPFEISETFAKRTTLPVNVRWAQPADLVTIAQIHIEAFHKSHILPALGPRFLQKYYELVMQFKQGIVLVAEHDGRIEGFAAGFLNPKQFYSMLKSRKWQLGLIIIRSLLTRPMLFRRLYWLLRRATQFMSRTETQPDDFCELASMAVRPSAARRGVGKALVGAFIARAKVMNASRVYLTTDVNNNEAANAFYRCLRFRLSDVFQTPRGRVLNEFVMPLEPNEQSVIQKGGDPADEAIV